MLVIGTSAAAECLAPNSISEKGACPFECCTYREWTVVTDTLLLEKPNDSAKLVGKAVKGTTVKGLTGIVTVTKPGKLEVLRDHTSESGHSYKQGDTVWIYTERGEGYFRVWYNGDSYDEEATFMYQGMGGWDSCVDAGACWGKRITFPESIWWVKVKTKKGIIGWSRHHEGFDNMDACG